MPDKMLDWIEKVSGNDYGNMINGKWQECATGETFAVHNPAKKDQVLGYFQNSNETDVEQAVTAAHRAFFKWSEVPGPERGTILLRFADLLEQNVEELAYMLSAEQGKVLQESRGEVMRAAKESRFSAGEGFRMEGKSHPSESPNVWNSTIRQPIGVVAAIAPWNFPVVTPVRKIAPAIAYGCTVVYKPASATPWTSVRLMELLAEAGLPEGVVNLVTGAGSNVGNPMVSHPFVKGISFTGSTKLGKSINEIAAKRLVRTQLELGGKNPAVVLDYDNPREVARQISGAAFACSGQRCTAISRVIVLEEKAEEITKAILEEMKNLHVGQAWDSNATMGPLLDQQHLNSVQDYLQIGREEGGELIYGGEVIDGGEYDHGSYMVPALFTGVSKDMRIAKEEIFGPVLSIMTAKNVEDAFEIANSVEYGLAASVFTDRLSSAYRFAEKIESGMVHVNHGTASQAHMPFGGVKQSGFGAYSIGSSNLEFFTEMKVLYFKSY